MILTKISILVLKSKTIRILNIYNSISKFNLCNFDEIIIGLFAYIVCNLNLGVLIIFLIFSCYLYICIITMPRNKIK